MTRFNKTVLPARRRRFRFSLRTLLALMTGSCLALGGWVHGVEDQRQAVCAIEAAGGSVQYDFEAEDATAPAAWLSERIGVDYVAAPISVWLPGCATDETLAHVGKLTQLQTLYISGPVGNAGISNLQELTDLRFLFLAGTKVSDAGLASLQGHQLLEVLSLDGAPISDAGLARLSGLARLRVLDLNGTRVSDVGLTHLGNLTSLQSLYLSNTDVTAAGLAHLGSLQDLEVLWLDDTGVDDRGLVHLGELAGLRHLSLSSTAVSDDSLSHLASLTVLEQINLGDTHVTDFGRERFRQTAPHCSILR